MKYPMLKGFLSFMIVITIGFLVLPWTWKFFDWYFPFVRRIGE